MSEWICIAVIRGVFGIQGEMRLESYTENPETCFSYGKFCTEKGQEFLTVKKWRKNKKGFVFKTEEVDNRTKAEGLTGCKLYIHRSKLPDLGQEEYYYIDLIGLNVYDDYGHYYGIIKSVQSFDSTDLLEIESNNIILVQNSKSEQNQISKREIRSKARRHFYLPFLKKTVKRIDLSAGKIIIEAEFLTE